MPATLCFYQLPASLIMSKVYKFKNNRAKVYANTTRLAINNVAIFKLKPMAILPLGAMMLSGNLAAFAQVTPPATPAIAPAPPSAAAEQPLKPVTAKDQRVINDTTAVSLNVLAHDQASFHDEVTNKRFAKADAVCRLDCL
jgi:hypothetical protein